MFTMLETQNGEQTLFASGELWGESGQQFGEWMEKLFEAKCPSMVVDLTRATGMNSGAIGKLLSVLKRSLEEGRTFKVVGCSDKLFELFHIIKLDTIMEIRRE